MILTFPPSIEEFDETGKGGYDHQEEDNEANFTKNKGFSSEHGRAARSEVRERGRCITGCRGNN